MRNTGGPAFPQSNDRVVASKPIEHSQGMALRDYFAVKAMQGFIYSAAAQGHFVPQDDALAKCAYDLADAMLKAREL